MWKTSDDWRRGYDDAKAKGPHEDMPNAEPVTKRETCEICGRLVAAVSVAKCRGHFSYWPSRPDRKPGWKRLHQETLTDTSPMAKFLGEGDR